MRKLDAKVFSSITPFAKQWILGDEMYDFLYDYRDFLSDKYIIYDLGKCTWQMGGLGWNWFTSSLSYIGQFPSSNDDLAEIYCPVYKTVTRNSQNKLIGSNLTISGATSSNITVVDTDKSSMTPDEFKEAMSGVYIIMPRKQN